LSKEFEEDAGFLVCSFGFVECIEEDGVELEAAEMDSPEEVGEGAIFC
jgi:hypothetical protein